MNSAPRAIGAWQAGSRKVNIRPPIRSRASRMMTERPAPASFEAAASPAAPAPTTITSGFFDINKTGDISRRFNILYLQRLETQLRSKGDPEIIVEAVSKVRFIARL